MIVKDSIAIVTGGASGLGLGIVKALQAAGVKVIVFDIDKCQLDKFDEHTASYVVDITNYEQVQKSVDNVISEYGHVDILVNNAGVIYNEPIVNIMELSKMKHSYDSFKKNIDINLNAVFIMSSIVIEKMILKRTKGVIINMSSISAKGNAGQTAYSAAKAGVEAMTKTWSKELGPFGIRTAAIAPGFINTDSTASALNDKIIKHLKDSTPLRRLGEIKNIASSVLHIIDNDFISGAVINVNGGLTI